MQLTLVKEKVHHEGLLQFSSPVRSSSLNALGFPVAQGPGTLGREASQMPSTLPLEPLIELYDSSDKGKLPPTCVFPGSDHRSQHLEVPSAPLIKHLRIWGQGVDRGRQRWAARSSNRIEKRKKEKTKMLQDGETSKENCRDTAIPRTTKRNRMKDKQIHVWVQKVSKSHSQRDRN